MSTHPWRRRRNKLDLTNRERELLGDLVKNNAHYGQKLTGVKGVPRGSLLRMFEPAMKRNGMHSLVGLCKRLADEQGDAEEKVAQAESESSSRARV